MNNILECEFFLLENMDCCLVVFQPYRPLVEQSEVHRHPLCPYAQPDDVGV